MARTDPQVNFRLPAELKAQLDEAARRSGRSLTAEIVYRLYQSLNSGLSGPAEAAEYAEIMKSLEGRDLNDYAVRGRPLRMPPQEFLTLQLERLQELMRGISTKDFENPDSRRPVVIQETLASIRDALDAMRAEEPGSAALKEVSARVEEVAALLNGFLTPKKP